MKATNHVPIDDWAKACTELTTPLRVRNVPKIDSRNVEKISQTFQVFNIPRFSCIMTECKNAVPVNHGISDAFSTGSQPQYPPQPSSAYDHRAPSRTPKPRHSQAVSVKRRV